MSNTDNLKLIRANGKLLLTGEYFVLDGALAIGLPTKYGQSVILKVSNHQTDRLSWTALDMYGEIWYEQQFNISDGQPIHKNSDPGKDSMVSEILSFIKENNPELWPFMQEVKTKMDFPLSWGLGTSSTLIYGISQLTEVDPYEMNESILGGSGYDIACAESNSALLYQRQEGALPVVKTIDLVFESPESCGFVYLGQKISSKEAIINYRAKGKPGKELIEKISQISQSLSGKVSHKRLMELMKTHESLVGNWLERKTIQEEKFKDFNGVIKSLGAWGGDFAMAISAEKELDYNYFYRKGYPNVLPYKALVLG